MSAAGSETLGTLESRDDMPGAAISPSNDDGSTPSTVDAASTMTNDVEAAAPAERAEGVDEGINGLVVVNDIQPAEPGDTLHVGGSASTLVQQSAPKSNSNQASFFAMHPGADNGADSSAPAAHKPVLSPADIQRNKLIAMHGKGTRGSFASLTSEGVTKNDVISPLRRSSAAVISRSGIDSPGTSGSTVRKRGPGLFVEVEEPDGDNISYEHGKVATSAQRTSRAREQVQK